MTQQNKDYEAALLSLDSSAQKFVHTNCRKFLESLTNKFLLFSLYLQFKCFLNILRNISCTKCLIIKMKLFGVHNVQKTELKQLSLN